jgi:DNA topoisomerase-1
LLRGMSPENVTLEVALQLLSLPRTLGTHPQSGEPVVAANGRFGPYIKCGAETRSLGADQSPLTIALDGALALLAQPKTRGRQAARREPLKVFPASPATGQPIQLLAGRYGPYLTDGTTNASLPKGMDPEEVTAQQAVEMLAARAAAGVTRTRSKSASTRSKKTTRKAPPTKSPTKKTSVKKASAKKAPTTKSSATKPSTKKSSTKKASPSKD